MSIFGPMLRRAAAGSSLRAEIANPGHYSDLTRKRPRPPVMSGVPDNIDTIRAIACILVVAFHVVGMPARGLQVSADSAWHYTSASFEFVRMPIFTILTGYLYASRRATRDSIAQLWSKRARRIAIPFAFCTVITVAVRKALSAWEPGYLYALTHSFDHLWFLQAIFLVFSGVAVWDAFAKPSVSTLVIACMAAMALPASSVLASYTLFSLNGAAYLLPFFLFGMILRLEPSLIRDSRVRIFAACVALAVLGYQQLSLNGVAPVMHKEELLPMVGGMSIVLLLIRYLPRIEPLDWLGPFSYTIYLWHMLALSAVRMGMQQVGIDSLPLLIVGSIAGGIAVPLALHSQLLQHKWLRLLSTGALPSKQESSATGARALAHKLVR